jgi:hypothetical protein
LAGRERQADRVGSDVEEERRQPGVDGPTRREPEQGRRRLRLAVRFSHDRVRIRKPVAPEDAGDGEGVERSSHSWACACCPRAEATSAQIAYGQNTPSHAQAIELAHALREQARLSDPGLAGDVDDAPGAGHHCLDSIGEGRQLTRPPEEDGRHAP